MAGLFLSFLVDYVGARFIIWRQSKKDVTSNAYVDADNGFSDPNSRDKIPSVNDDRTQNMHRITHVQDTTDEKLSVVVLEAGIIFHSLCTSSLSPRNTRSMSVWN